MDNLHPSDQKSQVGPESFSARAILGLAIPALGALVIEPLLTFIDSVMVAHLGVSQLGGLALGAAILTTVVGVCVFLAYATTAQSAQMVGRGDRKGAIETGIQAIWLSLGIGVVMTAIIEATAPLLAQLLGASTEVLPFAVDYLRTGAPGIIGMFVILAATGILRGLLDTKTPLYVLAAGAVLNIAGNFLFIFALGWGVRGAGISLSLTQSAMALALVAVVAKKARSEKALWTPTTAGVRLSAATGLPLFWRTVSLRLALLATLAVAAHAGTIPLGAYQVTMSVWTMAAFALDALAIAAQGLVGVALGSGRQDVLRALVRRLTRWGLGAGLLIGVVVAVTSPWLPLLFGSDQDMYTAATSALVVAGCCMPVAAVVFQLDGILIGANEGRFLAWMGLVTVIGYLPVLAAVYWWIDQRIPLNLDTTSTALILLWLAFAGWFMVLRAVTNWTRAGKLGA